MWRSNISSGHLTGLLGSLIVTILSQKITEHIFKKVHKDLLRGYKNDKPFYLKTNLEKKIEIGIEFFESIYNFISNPYISIGMILSNIVVSKKDNIKECYEHGKATIEKVVKIYVGRKRAYIRIRIIIKGIAE